jgi:hypothetical protein
VFSDFRLSAKTSAAAGAFVIKYFCFFTLYSLRSARRISVQWPMHFSDQELKKCSEAAGRIQSFVKKKMGFG